MKFEVGQHVIMKGQGPLWGRRRVIIGILDPGYYTVARPDKVTETCHIGHESDFIPEEPVRAPTHRDTMNAQQERIMKDNTFELLDHAQCHEAMMFLKRIQKLENDDLWAFARLIAETKLPPGTTGTTLGDVFHTAKNMVVLENAQRMIYNFNEGE